MYFATKTGFIKLNEESYYYMSVLLEVMTRQIVAIVVINMYGNPPIIPTYLVKVQ
jgi:hypothetical protein